MFLLLLLYTYIYSTYIYAIQSICLSSLEFIKYSHIGSDVLRAFQKAPMTDR